METCKQCRWARVDLADPSKGVCLYGSGEASAEEVAAGTAQRVLTGKAIKLSDEACEHFEKKPPRRQLLREGF